MSVLHEPGDLARTPLAALLLAALNEKASGVLTVQHPQGNSRLFFRTGMPVGAQTFMGFDPLGQRLLQRGLIDMAALDQSLARMAASGRQQGRILVEMGAITQAVLDEALAEQQGAYVSLIASLDAGAYRFDAQAAVPEWTREIRISPPRIIVEALEKPQAGRLVAAALGQAGTGTLALTPVYRQVAAKFAWREAEQELVARLQVPVRLETLLAAAALPPLRARAILAALVLLGLAEEAAAPTAPAPRVPQGLAADLASVGEQPPGATPEPGRGEPPATPAPAPSPARRSDPEGARRRRQRLLSRAIRNMGVGPLTPPPAAPPGGAGAGGAGEPRAAAGARPAPTAGEAALRRAFGEISPRAKDPDFFSRLGLPHSASPEQVKQAYLGLARQLHPDRFLVPALSDLALPVKELFAALNEAYATLSDANRRREYQARFQGGAAGPLAAEAAHVDYQKGEACARTHDLPKARAFFESAIRGNPARAEYKAALAATYLDDPKGRDPQKAQALLDEAIQDKSCDRALFLAGLLAREQKDEQRSEKLLRAALKANPGNADAQREVRIIDERRRSKGDERVASKK